MVTVVFHRPRLYPKQFAAIYDARRIVVIEASTKSGKTHGCIVWLFEKALAARPGQHVWWIAPVYRQAKIAYRRLRRWLIRQGAVFKASDSELTITPVNGVMITFLSADNPDNLYGEDVAAAVMDEASRAKEDAWFAIRSTLTATRGPIRLIGNCKGRKNWLYRLGARARDGDPTMGYHKLTAYDAVEGGVLDAEEVEHARAGLPEHVFRELYLAEPTDDGANPFDLRAIAGCLAPLSSDPPVCWGWDLAKSVDWTVGIGLDAQRRVCRLLRWQQVPWQETIQRIQVATGKVPALVDSTGVGDPIVEVLQKPYTVPVSTPTRDWQGRPGLTTRDVELRPDSNYAGFKFTTQTRQQLLEGLAVAIQRQQIRFPAGAPGAPTFLQDELESFEYEVKHTMTRYVASGAHDDGVMALALANRAWMDREAGSVPRLAPLHY